jgi:asparagine synthetase B (glutamine-hydrolysing)
MRAEAAGRNAVSELIARLPPEFPQWSSLAQDQYLEIQTLLSGYLLSSQGDRMLMAHSVEGRFPFLDEGVVALANSLPPAHKLRVLDEKHVLKRVAEPIVPPEIIARKKQPFRAPNALSFVSSDAPPYIADALSGRKRLRGRRGRAAAGKVSGAGRNWRPRPLEFRQHGAGRGAIDPAPAPAVRCKASWRARHVSADRRHRSRTPG